MITAGMAREADDERRIRRREGKDERCETRCHETCCNDGEQEIVSKSLMKGVKSREVACTR